jgi:hypothetical protein
MAFGRPNLFWLPKQLPFLKVGETRFHRSFPVRKFTGFQAGLMRGWAAKLDGLNRQRSTCAASYIEQLGLDGTMPIYSGGHPYNRFPVYVEDRAARDTLCEAGMPYGITAMYPFPVNRIGELKGHFDGLPLEGAESVSDTLATLPTHSFLLESDAASIRERVRSAGLRRNGADRRMRADAG